MFEGLTEDQQDELEMVAEAMLSEAKNALNDDTVRQVCFTMFNIHWLVTYWRNIDNLIEDSWTNYITPIIGFGVDTVIEDMPNATNVTARKCLMNDNTIVEFRYVDEDEDDE